MRDEEDFCGALETMDLRPLQGKIFIGGISTGPRKEYGILPSTIRGPMTFEEMIEFVGTTWKERTLHSRVFASSRFLNQPNEYLDPCTIDYIEAHWQDILMDLLINGELSEKEFTCTSEIIKIDATGEMVDPPVVEEVQ